MAPQERKKPWGVSGHPWLLIPHPGLNLWVTLAKIKVKKEEIRKLDHSQSFLDAYYKEKGPKLSREI